MDRRHNGGGGDYGHDGGGPGRVGGNRSSFERRPNQDGQEDGGGGGGGGGDGGRWQNDMYDSNAQQPRRSHGGGGDDYRERGGYQHDQRDQRGDGGRRRSRGYGGGGREGGFGGGGGRRDNHRGGGGGGGGGYRENQEQTNNGFGGQSAQQNWPTPGGASAGGGDGNAGDRGAGEGGGNGSERWQKHAQIMSGKSGGGGGGGGGGGYHSQRHGKQNQRPEVSGEREQGRVCSLKDSFGFVRCMDRAGDLFFHLTEAPPNINVGDEVDFFVGMGSRGGKDCALKLNLLPPGTVTSEVVLDASFLGVVERDIRAYPSSMPSTHRANMMGRSRPHESQQAEGLIKITGAAPPEEIQAAAESTAADKGEDPLAGGPEVGDSAQASPENETAVTDGSDSAAAAYTAPETEDAAAVQSSPPSPVGDGITAAPLGLQGAMVSYLVTDALEEDAGFKFRRGDEVSFKVSQDKTSGKKRAVEVVLIRTNREKREEEQLKKLIDSGATRQQGVVKKISHDYGFLQSLSCPDTVYFNTAHVVQTRDGERLRVGSQAEFWVVPDRAKDHRESFRALEIKILPPGTLKLEEETHKKLSGTVDRVPTLPQRQSFGGREGGAGGGGMQPGSARFAIPAAAEASPEGEPAATATSVLASLNHKELGKSQVPTLEVGDIIEADLWRSNLGKGATYVKNVKLVSFGGERVSGVVKSLRDGGFGFIRPLGGTEDVYFRVNDTCKGLPDLREGSEVVFTQHEPERGGEKRRATRVEVFPNGTLKVEVPLASGVSGVVTRDAKGSGQGMITITDGNNLEMPAEVKFPQIAAQIRKFAKSDENKLVLPGNISAGERSAARGFAVGEGLGCETRGDGTDRALHVWKPASEEETASIKEAEEKRAEKRSNDAKERSKNGEKSLSVPFTREDTASTKPDGKPQEKAIDSKGEAGGEGGRGNGPTQKPSKSKLTQDFRTEKGFAGYAAAAQRGDLVTFDVVLNRGNMRRRAANVKVIKRAAPQSSNTISNIVGSLADSGTGQEDSSGQEKEFMGVVSLVQLERHYGFIEVLDMDERVFFHLSDVLPDDNSSCGAVAEGVPEMHGTAATTTTTTTTSTSTTTTSGTKPIIRRGQEVAFRMGQRQGKPLGLSVRKLRPGTLPTEESLPCRFVGVVVVPPRNIGTDKEKDAMASAAGMEGMLVMLHTQNAASGGEGNTAASEAIPQGDEAAQQRDEAAAEGSSALEAEKEVNKAQRMLSLAGIRVASDAASSLPSSAAQQQQPLSSASSPLLNLNGISPGKRRSPRGRGAAVSKGPPRFSVLRFLATIEGEGVGAPAAAANRENVPSTVETESVKPVAATAGVDAQTATARAGAGGGAVSYGRGDLVEFTVVARRGQRQQSQRVGNVSLLTKAALPCRRGKVQQVDTKAGVARVELLQGQSPAGKGKEKGITAGAAAATADAAIEGEGSTLQASTPASRSVAGANGSPVFFLLKEMVGAAGPLRNGDEVDFMVPAPLPGAAPQKSKGINLAGGGHAVGAVRVQDLKSLSGARQRLNINLRDSHKGPQVRMAQGPDGDGFKQGHRASASLYADKSAAEREPATTDETTVLKDKASASGIAADATTASEVDVTETVTEEEQKATGGA